MTICPIYYRIIKDLIYVCKFDFRDQLQEQKISNKYWNLASIVPTIICAVRPAIR
jgi:hypothetical protein